MQLLQKDNFEVSVCMYVIGPSKITWFCELVCHSSNGYTATWECKSGPPCKYLGITRQRSILAWPGAILLYLLQICRSADQASTVKGILAQ